MVQSKVLRVVRPASFHLHMEKSIMRSVWALFLFLLLPFRLLAALSSKAKSTVVALVVPPSGLKAGHHGNQGTSEKPNESTHILADWYRGNHKAVQNHQ